MLDNPPYQSPLLDRMLHMKLQTIEGMLYSRVDSAFKTVALIGMLLPDQPRIKRGDIHDKDLYSEDMFMLGRSFRALSASGLPLHPDAKFQVYNILPPVQSDYLLAADPFEESFFPQNDLSILMYLPKYGTPPNDPHYMGHKGFASYNGEDMWGSQSWRRYTSVSQMHREFNAWSTASSTLGSKFVITHGGIDDEVTTEEFAYSNHYRILIDSRQNQMKKNQYSRHNMGVLIHQNAVNTYKPTKTSKAPDSDIAAALYKLEP